MKTTEMSGRTLFLIFAIPAILIGSTLVIRFFSGNFPSVSTNKPTPTNNTDPIVSCSFENCGTMELTKSHCDSARCCKIGSDWKLYSDSTSCTQAQTEWKQSNKVSTQNKPSQPINFKETAPQNNNYQNSDPAQEFNDYLKESCQENWRDYNNCISEKNAAMMEYNTCLSEKAAGVFGTEFKTCMKPSDWDHFCIKPSC